MCTNTSHRSNSSRNHCRSGSSRSIIERYTQYMLQLKTWVPQFRGSSFGLPRLQQEYTTEAEVFVSYVEVAKGGPGRTCGVKRKS